MIADFIGDLIGPIYCTIQKQTGTTVDYTNRQRKTTYTKHIKSGFPIQI